MTDKRRKVEKTEQQQQLLDWETTSSRYATRRLEIWYSMDQLYFLVSAEYQNSGDTSSQFSIS